MSHNTGLANVLPLKNSESLGNFEKFYKGFGEYIRCVYDVS